MSIPVHTPMSERSGRFEVFTGAGRRRRFSEAEKATIVAESYEDEISVCGVARRHGLSPSQLFTWRRQARSWSKIAAEPPLFVPAIMAPAVEPPRGNDREMQRVRRRRSPAASIELEVGGVVVRVGPDAGAEAIAAVIGALKAGS